MTIEEIINTSEQDGFIQGYSMDISFYTEENIEGMLKRYARLKCEELLEIVAEKVNIRHTFTNTIDKKTAHDYDKTFIVGNSMFSINKGSMFSVVDLDKFIE